MSTTYTRMMLTALMMVFTLSSPASSASPRAVAAKCKPYKIPVEIDSPNHRYRPYSVELYRCLGECSHVSPQNCECVAVTQKDRKVSIIVGLQKFQEIILQDHTSCKDKCKASIKNMCKNGGHQWNEQTCTCTCPTAPTANPCNANQRWESGKCQCVCKTKPQACPKGMKWNSSLCKCQCNLEMHIQCSKLRNVTNLKTCKCENTQAAITRQVAGKKCELNKTCTCENTQVAITGQVAGKKSQISFPLDNVTYWSPGSLVKLPWTYNISTADILAVEISFTKSGSSTAVTLAEGFGGVNPISKDPSKFTTEGQATLVFKNANLGHNGTYALAVTLRHNAGQQRSEVKVVILVQISFPLDNVTYWSPGSLVKLPWTYNIPTADILAIEISFTKSGSSKAVTLAAGFVGANLISKDPSKFTIEGQATLVFKNANLGHSGTYALAATLRHNAGQQRSEVKVVILAQISFPLGNVTYWTPGSLVKLPWTYNIPTADILAVEISFTKSGSSTAVTLAEGFGGVNPISKDPSKFTIEGQAALEFKNANLGHNGTYALAVTLKGSAGRQRSEVKVVILEQPIAKKTCSDKNGNFYCVCKSDVGNPLPLAYWSKDGKNIGDFGDNEKNLTVNDITKGEAAIYSCNVKSHNLTDQKNITLEAPKITSFGSDPEDPVPLNTPVTFTCKVADGILPTMFNISFNGKDLGRIQNGVKTIDKFTKDNVGSYKCMAFNIIGPNLSQELKLNFARKTNIATTRPTTSEHGNGTTEQSNLCKDKICTRWYMFFIISSCGIAIGIFFICSAQWIHRRLRNRTEHSQNSESNPPDYTDVAQNNSPYDELNLETMDTEDNYQSLRENVRSTRIIEEKTGDESNYEELDN